MMDDNTSAAIVTVAFLVCGFGFLGFIAWIGSRR